MGGGEGERGREKERVSNGRERVNVKEKEGKWEKETYLEEGAFEYRRLNMIATVFNLFPYKRSEVFLTVTGCLGTA